MRLAIVVLISLTCIGSSSAQSEQSFIEQPTNTSVLEGSEAILKCIVGNQQGQVVWCRDSFCTFGRNRSLSESSRLIIIGDATKGEHNLVIRNSTIKDNVTYQCQVTASLSYPAIKSQIVHLTVLISPKKINIISNLPGNLQKVQLTMRKNKSVDCVAEDSNPPVAFNWYLDNKLLSVGNGAFEISKQFEQTANKLFKTTGKLIAKIDVDSEWNEKNLTCEAYNEATELTKLRISDQKEISVSYAPIVFVKMTTMSDIIDGEFVQFECVADARPPITNYKWFIDDKVYSNGLGEKYLSFKVDMSMHKKHLKCNATNDAETQTASYLMDVAYGPKFAKLLPTHKLVELNGALNLNCEVQSNPQSVIIWKLNGSYLYAYPNFSISAMQPENYGVYTCEASLKNFPAVSSSIKIVPPGPPIIITEPVQYSYYGHSAKIDYLMENEPKAQTVKFYKEDEWLDISKYPSKYQTSAIDIPTKGLRTILSINNIEQVDFGNYTIVASNQYGESKMRIQLEPKASSWEGFLVTTIALIVVAIVLMSTVGYVFYKRYAKTKHRRNRSKCRENSQGQSTFVLKKNKPNKRMHFSRPQISRMTPYNIDGLSHQTKLPMSRSSSELVDFGFQSRINVRRPQYASNQRLISNDGPYERHWAQSNPNLNYTLHSNANLDASYLEASFQTDV